MTGHVAGVAPLFIQRGHGAKGLRAARFPRSMTHVDA